MSNIQTTIQTTVRLTGHPLTVADLQSVLEDLPANGTVSIRRVEPDRPGEVGMTTLTVTHRPDHD